ncbi:MAG: sll0787 family AIR synthase-like protein [Verrucomicrobiota bacterium]
MSLDPETLSNLAVNLSKHPAVVEKARISYAYTPATHSAGGVPLGDDCAAIPDPEGNGYLLFAAEGMLPSFVQDDPWFAGYSAVMVNLSDVAAMGGRPLAITDVLWTPSEDLSLSVWEGLTAASSAYGVPIVGGHTTRITPENSAGLAAAVLGRGGENLITSFDARPGDRLVIAIDMAGDFRNDKPFWNASTTTPSARLRAELELLPILAEAKLCRAGKDISNGGISGTLAMLCASSSVGVTLDLDHLPIPPATPWERWLTSFPSYGYLLAVPPDHVKKTKKLFSQSEITITECGFFDDQHSLRLRSGGMDVRLTFATSL